MAAFRDIGVIPDGKSRFHVVGGEKEEEGQIGGYMRIGSPVREAMRCPRE